MMFRTILYPASAVTSEPAIAAYYDRLTLWTRLMAACGWDRQGLAVHRALADPRAAGRATPTRLHDIVAEALAPFVSRPRVLDAGCGLGGTMIDLARRLGGRYVGLTVSKSQAKRAVRAIDDAGLRGTAEVLVGSFDDPPPGPFDVVVAIESLAHSADPAASLSAMAGVLAPGSLLLIVDDMPGGRAEAPLLSRFRSGWHCPVLWGAEQYRVALASRGAALLVDRDLSDGCRPRPEQAIRRLERVNRALWRAIPGRGWRSLMDSHYGGLALERLYRARSVEYRLLLARLR